MGELININKNIGFKHTVFPDTQSHVQLDELILNSKVVFITCSLINTETLFKLLLVNDALEQEGITEKYLYIPYLMGARYDRIMREGDSFDLRVIVNLINSCNFTKVYILDPHSSISTLLINKSREVEAIPAMLSSLLWESKKKDITLICPDYGATKKLDKYIKTMKNVYNFDSSRFTVVYCNKKRNVETGSIELTINEPEKCRDAFCIIMDDICDGGGTFIEIAKKLQDNKPSELNLIVTHGIFSKGFEELSKYFSKILTTNSLCKIFDTSTPTLEFVTFFPYEKFQPVIL